MLLCKNWSEVMG